MVINAALRGFLVGMTVAVYKVKDKGVSVFSRETKDEK
jgi:hypothetical protein